MEPLYSFEISRALLQAMALFQSGDDTRFILNSTKFELIEQGGHNELTLASTDGRRMAVYRLQILADSLLTALPERAEFSIDLSGVKKLPKVRGSAGRIVTCSVFPKHAEITCEKYKYKADFITEAEGGPNKLGVFPNWRGVIPVGEPIALLEFAVNFEYLASFGAAAKLLTDSSSIITRSYGEGDTKPIAVQFPNCRDFYGVLMPIRVEGEPGQQDWVKGAAKAKKTEVAA